MALIGCVDFVTKDHVTGWVFEDENPSEHVSVAVQLAGTTIASAAANRFREDLRGSGFGDGDHAYVIKLDGPIAEDQFEHLGVVVTAQNGETLSLEVPERSDETIEDVPADVQGQLAHIQRQLERSIRYGAAYADAAELLPPAGYPADFIGDMPAEAIASAMEKSPADAIDRIRRDTLPIPHPENRERYAEKDHLSYWLSGYTDAQMLQRIAAEYGVTGGRFFDFGGSTGRVFRHFALQGNAWQVWTCDFKISSVEFNLRYFPNEVRTFLNSSLPALPIPDGYFNLIAACSVFTHIDETETGWLLELRRTLQVGGIALLSIHSKDTWTHMHPDLREYVVKYRPDIAGHAELPEGKTVVTFREDDPYRCQTFHSDDYIRRNWGRFFEICDIRPLTLGEQAVVVCRRMD